MIPVQNITVIAGADLSSARYLFVKMTANGLEKAGAGENAIGVLQTEPALGQAGTVMALGISHVKFGAAVAKGANVTSDAAGKAVTAGGGDAILGIAMEAAADADEIRQVLLVTRTSSGVTGLAAARTIVTIPVELADLDNCEIMTDYIPGFAGSIEKVTFITGDPATTADKAADLSLEIEAAAVTGGALALTTAGCDTRGKVVAGTAITDNNTFTAAEKISILVADGAAAFVEGTGFVLLTLKQ